MKEILLTQGKVALVSDHRYKYLMQWKWYAYRTRNGHWYAARFTGGRRNKEMLLMHRVIMSPLIGMVVDHIDGNGLNNVDENLRCCTVAENVRNSVKQKNNSTGYKGVRMRKQNLKAPYEARINANGKSIHLGFFRTAEDAAKAYDDAAKKHHGTFARINFP